MYDSDLSIGKYKQFRKQIGHISSLQHLVSKQEVFRSIIVYARYCSHRLYLSAETIFYKTENTDVCATVHL